MKKSSPKKLVVTNASKLKSKKIVEYNSSSGEEVEDLPKRKGAAGSKNGGPATTDKSPIKTLSAEKVLSKNYLMWDNNNANLCWLDASMAMLVHNKTLVQSLVQESTSQIVAITRNYYAAVSILNDDCDERLNDEKLQNAKALLKTVQDSALKYLQPILKYKDGEPDSAFCSLYNLITEDKAVRGFFDLEFSWVQVCKKCNTQRVKTHKKPIVTLSRVGIFEPSSPIAIYQCPVCKEPDQHMTLKFRTLPQCLLFHFESGAGKGEMQCTDFEVDGRTYRMTGVMTMEKGKDDDNINHFNTFIRDLGSDTWLECNDLIDEIKCFCLIPYVIKLEEVFIIMYEAADSLGTVDNSSLALDKSGLGEESASGSSDIPLIDLEDDTDMDSPGEKSNRGCNEPRLGSRRCKNVGLLESSDDESSPSVSETLNPDPTSDIKEICVASEKDMSRELVPLKVVTKHVVLLEEKKSNIVIMDVTKKTNATSYNSIANVISKTSKDLKVTDESAMLNPQLCPKIKLEKSVQNISSFNPIKSIHVSPTIIKASNIFKSPEISSKTSPGSPKSEGLMLAKTYEKLMCTLKNARLKQEGPLAMFRKSGKSKVPKTELSNKLVAKELKSENKPLMMQISKDFNSEVFHTDSVLKKPSETTIINTVKASCPNIKKSQPNQCKQEHKVPNFQMFDSGFVNESEQGLVNVKQEDSTNLTATISERRLLHVASSKRKSRLWNSSNITPYTITPYKKKDKYYVKQAIQPKRKYLRKSVHVSDSINVDTESPVAVDAKKHISVMAEKPVKQGLRYNRKGNSTLPEMEQTADENTPADSKGNLEGVGPKSKTTFDMKRPVALDANKHISVDTEKPTQKTVKCNRDSKTSLHEMAQATVANTLHSKQNVEADGPKSLLQRKKTINLKETVDTESPVTVDTKKPISVAAKKPIKKGLRYNTDADYSSPEMEQTADENTSPHSKRNLKGVGLKSETTVDTSMPVAVHTTKHISVAAKKPIKEKLRCKRDANSTSPEMEQTTDANIPHSQRNLKAAGLKPLPQRKKSINLEDTVDTEIPVAVDTKKPISVAAEKPVKKRLRYNTDADSSLPEMEQTADENTPPHSKRILEVTGSKFKTNVDTEIPISVDAEKSQRNQVTNFQIVDAGFVKESEHGLVNVKQEDSTIFDSVLKKPSETTIINIVKAPPLNVENPQPKQDHKAPNFQIVDAGLVKESEQGLVNVKQEDSAYLTVATTKRQLLPVAGSNKKSRLGNSSNITPYKKKKKYYDEQAVHLKKKYLHKSVCAPDSINVETETPVAVDNKKHISETEKLIRKLLKSSRDSKSTLHDMNQIADANTLRSKRNFEASGKEIYSTSPEMEQCTDANIPPHSKRNLEGVILKSKTTVNTEIPVAVDATKHVSVAAKKLIKEKLRCKRDANSTSPEMEQSTDANIPHRQRNWEAADPKCPLQRKKLIILEDTVHTERPVAVNAKEPISVAAEKPVKKSLRYNREGNSTLPEMKQTADENNPPNSKRNLEAAGSKLETTVNTQIPISADAKKSQPNQRKPEHQVPNFQIDDAGFVKESEQGLVNVKQEDSTNLDSVFKKPSETTIINIVKAPPLNVENPQPKQDHKAPNFQIVDAGLVKESEQGLVNVKQEDSAYLTVATTKRQLLPVAGSNKKSRLGNSSNITPYKKKKKYYDEPTVHPKKKYLCKSVCAPDSINVDTETPVAVDNKKRISETEKLIRKLFKCNRDRKSTLPDCLLPTLPKSPPQRKKSINLEETVDTESPVDAKIHISVAAEKPIKKILRYNTNADSTLPEKEQTADENTPPHSKRNLEGIDPKSETTVDMERLVAVDANKHISLEAEKPIKERLIYKRYPNSTPPKMEQTADENTPPHSKRNLEGVGLKSETTVDTQMPLAVDAKKHISVAAKKHINERLIFKRYPNSTSPKMEQCTDANIPHCQRNLEAAVPKSPPQHKKQINLETTTKQKPVYNHYDQILHACSYDNCTLQAELDKQFPCNSNKDLNLNYLKLTECREDCDCDTCITADNIVDNVLDPFVGFFDIRQNHDA